jgi:hypothetical protein
MPIRLHDNGGVPDRERELAPEAAVIVSDLDSASTGDPSRHVDLSELDRRLDAMRASPRDVGIVRALVRRADGGGRRELLDSVTLSEVEGMPGDAWGRRPDRTPESQLTAVEWGVAELIANGHPIALFGDQLFLELDLSKGNLPVGSRVRLGAAVLEVSPKAHNGCQKYRRRFGPDALRFASRPDSRHRNFRGIYFRVVTEGLVRVGDPARVLSRPE